MFIENSSVYVKDSSIDVNSVFINNNEIFELVSSTIDISGISGANGVNSPDESKRHGSPGYPVNLVLNSNKLLIDYRNLLRRIFFPKHSHSKRNNLLLLGLYY